MKIPILTYGSRGDVQPFLALVLGLQKVGHIVTLAAPHRFEAFALQCRTLPTSLFGEVALPLLA